MVKSNVISWGAHVVEIEDKIKMPKIYDKLKRE